MGLVGPIFEQYPSNLVRNHIFHSCKSAEILVRKSQVVLDLAKSVWSVLSISSDILGLPCCLSICLKISFSFCGQIPKSRQDCQLCFKSQAVVYSGVGKPSRYLRRDHFVVYSIISNVIATLRTTSL